MEGSLKVVASLLVVVAMLVVAAVAVAAAPPPFKTVAQTQTLILDSQFADQNAITDVTCVGLVPPKPKTNVAGQSTFHRFRCRISGAYFDIRVIVVLTGKGFVVLPNH
jgi:hypothetical protein